MNSESNREREHGRLARMIARESIVLLKNDQILPLDRETKIALLGNGAGKTVKGGTGSGDVNNRKSITIYEGLMEYKACLTSKEWIEDYESRYEQARERWKDKILSDAQKVENPFDAYANHPFAYPDGRAIKQSDIQDAEVAIYVISRICGEGKDRRLEAGDYYLSEREREDIRLLCKQLPVILVLNAGGVIELTDLLEEESNIKAVLHISQLGQEGGRAVSDILFGEGNPSGKLTATWPRRYEDLPYGNQFSYLNGNLEYEEYQENIYVGYRYFTTFGVKPLYPFGYGLSYTTFDLQCTGIQVAKKVQIGVMVTNTGNRAGKQVVQIYAKLPEGNLEKESLRLVGFAKTAQLQQGEKEELFVTFGAEELASFDEATQTFVIEQGYYTLYMGTDCEQIEECGRLIVKESTIIHQVSEICPQQSEFEVLSRTKKNCLGDYGHTEEINTTKADVPVYDFAPLLQTEELQAEELQAENLHTNEFLTEDDIPEDLQTIPVEQLFFTLLGNITEGASNLGSSGKRVPGSAGETTERLEKEYGYPSLIMADGPAGLRLRQTYEVDKDSGEVYGLGVFGSLENGYLEPMVRHKHAKLYEQYCTAFPVGTALAQTFNRECMEQFGNAIGSEMQEFGVDLWLAPGLNIQRNPLCGRNFEYYSEDPLVSGIVAECVTRGVQSRSGCGVTIKHFACNNQEDNRMSVDARVTQRALREIYLRGFAIAVQRAKPIAVMTSYNLINSVHTANQSDLCTKVLREEWKFDGLVMSDWNTTVPDDGSIPYLCCMAGNDVIMPGNPNDLKNIKEAFQQGLLTEEAVRKSAGHLLKTIKRLQN